MDIILHYESGFMGVKHVRRMVFINLNEAFLLITQNFIILRTAINFFNHNELERSH